MGEPRPNHTRDERREAIREVGYNAPLPEHYQWGEDAMESYDFGRKRATDAILSALHPVEAAEGWRPITDEQKNGQPILAGSINHDVREVVEWGVCPEQDEPGWVNTGTQKDRFYANPLWFTHWRPLPSPPSGLKPSLEEGGHG